MRPDRSLHRRYEVDWSRDPNDFGKRCGPMSLQTVAGELRSSRQPDYTAPAHLKLAIDCPFRNEDAAQPPDPDGREDRRISIDRIMVAEMNRSKEDQDQKDDSRHSPEPGYFPAEQGENGGDAEVH